jgi:hypothetical protein
MSANIPAYASAVFAQHGVPAEDQAFVFAALDRLIEEDIDHADASEAATKAVLSEDSYEELLQQHQRGHRRNRAWFRSQAFADAVPTKRCRALLADFVKPEPQPPVSVPAVREGRS